MTHPQTQDDEALVEVMARAIEQAFVDESGGFSEVDNRKIGRLCATAALTALRNHEGRK